MESISSLCFSKSQKPGLRFVASVQLLVIISVVTVMKKKARDEKSARRTILFYFLPSCFFFLLSSLYNPTLSLFFLCFFFSFPNLMKDCVIYKP